MANELELIERSFAKVSLSDKADISSFGEAVRPVAEAYGCSCIVCEVPVKKGRKQTYVLYGGENYEKYIQFLSSGEEDGGRVVRSVGEPGVWGSAQVIWVCPEDMPPDDRTREDLSFICRLICLMTERIRLNMMARRFFYTDEVTGLDNINGLMRFTNSLKNKGNAHCYCAAQLNLVGYNYINKKVGYRAGNRLLKQYCSKMRGLLCEDETMARLGGDNFMIVYKRENGPKIEKAIEGIAVRCRSNSAQRRFVISARAGIYDIRYPEEPFEVIFSHTAATLNYARKFGRTSIIRYSEEIERRVMEYKGYVQRFREGLEKQEFFVVFQPKVYTRDNTLYGGEALVRWDRGGSVIYPGDFIEVLEQEHLIATLDLYVLEHTCMALRKWIDSGADPVKISVNFSNDHLWDSGLVDDIVAVVDRYGIDHSLIEIEMTETADVNEIPQLMTYVELLHSNGFTVAMDDFGTGYSSLQILQSVSVDVLKIDRSFVTAVAEDKNKRENVILRHIINMADDLGVEIVAEGVETGIQRENLIGMNCHRIQGYVFDKPLSEDEFMERIRARTYI